MCHNTPEIPGREVYGFEPFTLQTHTRWRKEVFWVLAKKMIEVPQCEFLCICQGWVGPERHNDCDTMKFHGPKTSRPRVHSGCVGDTVAGMELVIQAGLRRELMWALKAVLRRSAMNSP